MEAANVHNFVSFSCGLLHKNFNRLSFLQGKIFTGKTVNFNPGKTGKNIYHRESRYQGPPPP